MKIVSRAVLTLLCVCVSFSVFAFDQAEEDAKFIYQRLTSKTLRQGTPRFNELVALVRAGKRFEAAQLAMTEDSFVASVVRHWGATLLTQGTSPSLVLNDALAMLMGSVRDNLDARNLVVGDYTYGADGRLALGLPDVKSNLLFSKLDEMPRELNKTLSPVTPQWSGGVAKETAGILTSRWWALTNYSAGTNRRAVVAAFDSFFCKPHPAWKKPNLPTDRIRQDIDRFPPGGPVIFQKECRTCHASMDAFAGAFSKLDFKTEQITWEPQVAAKYVQHSEVYPDGYVTTDNSWINYLTDDPNNIFGWSQRTKGNGVKEFGMMIAETRLFSDCMTKRTIQEVCRKDLMLNDSMVAELSQQFRDQGYKLRDLFAAVAAHSQCR